MDFINQSKDVFKRIHPSGAETCVKTVDAISEEKSTVFISSSAGCPLKCKFCHLTIKDHKYKPLSPEEIVSNTVETINWAAEINPKIKEKKIKLSWMGMGDASFIIGDVKACSDTILGEVGIELDKIDLSTALPTSASHWSMGQLKYLQESYGDKFRLFYSLFSGYAGTRAYMLPRTHSQYKAMQLFADYDLKVIAHQIYLEGVNDSRVEVNQLLDFVDEHFDTISELRILRYNECENSWWYESTKYRDIIHSLREDTTVPLKLQESPGKEIKAACGMFHELR